VEKKELPEALLLTLNSPVRLAKKAARYLKEVRQKNKPEEDSMKTRSPRRIGLKRRLGDPINRVKEMVDFSKVIKDIHGKLKKYTYVK
jgi:hypothetical protein